MNNSIHLFDKNTNADLDNINFNSNRHLLYIKDILIHLNEYYNIISIHNTGSNDPDMYNIKNNIIQLCNNNNLLTKILHSINTLDKDTGSIQILMNWVGSISIIAYLIDMNINITKLLNINQLELVPKYNKIVLLNKKRINDMDNCIITTYNEICKKIYQTINKKEEQSNNLTTVLEDLSNHVINNILLYTAYSSIVSTLIEYLEKNNMTYLISIVLLNIENLKNKITKSEICYENITSIKDFSITIPSCINVKKNICETNPYIKTFGLSPISKYDTLPNIVNTALKEITLKKKINKEKDLTDASVELNYEYCFILIIKNIISPIEFDIWKLYDKKESSYFRQIKNSGVDKLFIDKFNTIKFVNKNKKWNHDIKMFGKCSEDTEKFIIFEKLNNDKYRILKKYKPPQLSKLKFNNFTDRIKYEEMSIFINDRDSISGLLDFINNNQMMNSGDRINQYNNIIEKKILNNMFLENVVDVKELSEDSKIVDIQLLKYNLACEVNKEIHKLLTKKYKKIYKKKDIIDLLHEECIISVFSQFLTDQYLLYISNRFKNYKNSSKLYYINDILKTFMSQLLILKISLKKKIHDEYLNKEKLLDDLISNSNSLKYIEPNISEKNSISPDIIKQFFDDLFIGIIDLLITDTDNIYLSLTYKTKLLELSLF